MKNPWKPRTGLREKGQAVFELILLLTVAAILVAGLTAQFFTPFGDWTRRMFSGEDSYLHCLIRYGILPGGESAECEPPTFEGGEALAARSTTLPQVSAGAGRGSSSVGTRNRRGAARSGGGGQSGSRRRTTGSGNNRGASNADTGPKRGGPGGIASANNRRGGSSFGGGSGSSRSAGAGEEDLYTGSDKSSSLSADFSGVRNSSNKKRIRTAPVGGQLDDQAQSKKGAAKQKGRGRGQKKKTATALVAQPKRKVAQEMKEESFGFGKMLRFVLILALLFAIIFFVGSQIFAVARGGGRRR